MKYISIDSVFSSWKSLIEHGQQTKASLTKFFGLLELIKNSNLIVDQTITANQQYEVKSSALSNSLQDLYYFGTTGKSFNSQEVLRVIFPTNWQENVLKSLLKNTPLPIIDVAILCQQNYGYADDLTGEHIVNTFKNVYHIGDEEEIFFSDENKEITFSDEQLDRKALFSLFKDYINKFDAEKTTIGFTKEFFSKQAGELTAGPFIQPLYAGQDNLKFLLIANFDIKQAYNINPSFSKKTLSSNLKQLPRNKIIYGAPGTGKSFILREQALESGFIEENIIRITFHPSYTYQIFVGSYKPTPVYKRNAKGDDKFYASNKVDEAVDQMEPLIDYTFVPGPFINSLVNALRNPNEVFMLVIEEINRANVAAVFGDVFQLLDRNEIGDSEYDIEFNQDIRNYLTSQFLTGTKFKIPNNLFIWATMNSADQGVMPLDSAFKRRWSFDFLSIDAKQDDVKSRTFYFQKKQYSWNKFRNDLNNNLKLLSIPEDKLIGPFFLNQKELQEDSVIKNKLLLYLRDDVVRHNPESLFMKSTFSDIVKAYDSSELVFQNLKSENWEISDFDDEVE